MVKLPSSKLDTVGKVLQWGEDSLAATSSSPRLDSEILLGHALRLSRTGLLARLRDACPDEGRSTFTRLVERRRASEPIAYIIGQREFFGLCFKVSSSVLIPRPETELVVEEAVRFLSGRSQVHFLDLGTGSGCLAISIVHELLAKRITEVSCDALDLSSDALEVAASNAEALGVERSIRFVLSDWCQNRAALSPPYDCIVANPPYVDPMELVPYELAFEPKGALYSDNYGLSDTERLLREAVPLLKPGGLLLCEVGAGKRVFLDALVQPYQSSCDISYLGDPSPSDSFCVIRLHRH